MSTTRLSEAPAATPPYAALEYGRVEEPWKCNGHYQPVNGPVPSCSEHHHHYHERHESAANNVVPLPLLGRFPALAECPGCRSVSPTSVRYRNGKGTHWMATFFLFSTGIFAFLPYSMDHFKNAEHSCMKCGRRLATQRFGGGTRSHLI
ncbi:hypothetical protein KJ359_005092 [Pestalotiopsis sp. 9143b]|nr:hypothetical protein KJ359_005092 [Pestalotiopsis sp. 9143b]